MKVIYRTLSTSRNPKPEPNTDLKQTGKSQGSGLRSPPRHCALASAPFPLHPTEETSEPEKETHRNPWQYSGVQTCSGVGRSGPFCSGSASSLPGLRRGRFLPASRHLLPGGRCGGRASADALVPLLTWIRLPRATPSLPPPSRANQSQLPKKVTSVGFPARPLSPIPVSRPEEPSQGEDGQKSGGPSWARWFSLSLTPSRD